MLSGSRSVIGSLSHLVWGCGHTGSAAAIGEEAAAVPPGGRVLAGMAVCMATYLLAPVPAQVRKRPSRPRSGLV